MIRRIRDLLYEQGFTISGARNKLQEISQSQRGLKKETIDDNAFEEPINHDVDEGSAEDMSDEDSPVEERELALESAQRASSFQASTSLPTLRRELMDIRDLLSI
jgi:hypothetical protein